MLVLTRKARSTPQGVVGTTIYIDGGYSVEMLTANVRQAVVRITGPGGSALSNIPAAGSVRITDQVTMYYLGLPKRHYSHGGRFGFDAPREVRIWRDDVTTRREAA